MGNKIITDELLANHNQRKYSFRDGTVLYIVFNSAGEYAYQLLFSTQKLDRIRFDCMDKKWEVKTKPNHFHPRYTEQAFESPMKGETEKDLNLLINLIKKGDLRIPK